MNHSRRLFPSLVLLSVLASCRAVEKTITVDVSQSLEVRKLHLAVDHGPQCQNPATGRDDGVNATAQLHMLGAEYIRTHDSYVLDWNSYYDHENMDADPEDPASYNFTQADAYFQTLLDAGIAPYFRLGTSFNGPSWRNDPPNITRMVSVFLHTVMHFNDGWAGGFSGHNVTYWEVWNEPDGADCNGTYSQYPHCFWNRTADDFFELAHETIVAIKTYDNSLKVGTCGVSLLEAHPDYSFKLIDRLAANNTPFDFFSWHIYTANTDLYVKQGSELREYLDNSGLHHVEHHISEWNLESYGSMQDEAEGAAGVVLAMRKMIDARVDLAVFYPLCSIGWGLLNATTGTAQFRKEAFGYQAVWQVQQETPLLLSAPSGPDEPDTPGLGNGTYGVLAMRNNEGTVFNILIAAQVTATTNVSTSMFNIPEAESWLLEINMLDDTSAAWIPVSSSVITPTEGTLTFNIPTSGSSYLALARLKVPTNSSSVSS